MCRTKNNNMVKKTIPTLTRFQSKVDLAIEMPFAEFKKTQTQVVDIDVSTSERDSDFNQSVIKAPPKDEKKVPALILINRKANRSFLNVSGFCKKHNMPLQSFCAPCGVFICSQCCNYNKAHQGKWKNKARILFDID